MVIGYCGSATRDDKKILEQEKRILSASGKSREEVKFFCDNGVSGLMLSEKTALRGALEYVKRGEVEALYVTSAHVLGRNTTELIDIICLCENKGTELHIIDAGKTITSTSNAVGIMMCHCMAGRESLIQSARTKDGIMAKRRREVKDEQRIID